MDYFSKFTKRIAPFKVQPTSAMQLAKFHKSWDHVHNIFFSEEEKATVVQQTEIPTSLKTMVDILVDEETRQEDSTAGVCMEYFLKNGILQYLVNEAEKRDYPLGFRGETIRMIANMINLLDNRFLVHNAVHNPTVRLLRFCVLKDSDELYTDDLVDLMYIICSKIHGFPALLNIFFHDTHWLTTPQRRHLLNPDDRPEYEFLLFTYLVQFVHREGLSGDYARSSLLFLVELATDQLGEFILGSDFATILAAGLGALYSQLPRKLVVRDSVSDHFVFSRQVPENTESVEYSDSPEFIYKIDSFLKLLEFCQDVLKLCPNEDIYINLLESVQSNFLESILYPSILECSDTDGSSVAVLSYIDLILQTVSQDDLAKVVVGYLMDSTVVRDIQPQRLLLRDLIFSRLESNSERAVISTLKLLKTLIVHHCRYAHGLLRTEADTDPKPMMVAHHLREVDHYFSLIAAIDADHAQDTAGYEAYLSDMEQRVCGCKTQTKKERKYGLGKKQPIVSVSRHRLHPSDKLMQILLNLLSHFFTHSIETNLALTGVITALGMCPCRSLEGWIGFSKRDRTVPQEPGPLEQIEPKDDDDDRSVDFGVEKKSYEMTRPVSFKSYPSLFTLLNTLIQQIEYYRLELPLFDTFLNDRRQGLIHGESDGLQQTESIRIQPIFPSHFINQEPIIDLDDDDECMFIPKAGIDPSKAKKKQGMSTEITLSMLLNNVVILEESIKEIVSLIQVRSSLGIDKVAYV